MTHRSRRVARVGVVALTGSTILAMGLPALANEGDDFEQPPGYEAPEPPEIDPNAPDLMLTDGATLADPEVRDIKFVTEDLGTPEDSGGHAPEEDGAPGEDTAGTEGDGADGGDQAEPPPTGGGGESVPAPAGREERTSGQHKFTLQTDVVFGKNSDEITDESRAALQDVAAAIDEHRPEQVNVFGFTDNLGSYENGEILSRGRAQNTHQVLVELIQDPSGIEFNVRGYSEDYPIYDNSTEEGRQGNRRVEISWPSSG